MEETPLEKWKRAYLIAQDNASSIWKNRPAADFSDDKVQRTVEVTIDGLIGIQTINKRSESETIIDLTPEQALVLADFIYEVLGKKHKEWPNQFDPAFGDDRLEK